jgi:ribosomal protein S12 methylthiotransferase accessory factor
MQINVRYLDNLKLEASFDDFKVISDQPIRYKGDGSAPGPFDYFLASSAMCAAYFVKVYCIARDISTEDIVITQDNVIDPEDRYKQTFNIQIQIPADISEKDRRGIIASMERCSVKRVIQQMPEFKITATSSLKGHLKQIVQEPTDQKTMILGKDYSLEETIENMSALISGLGIKLEIASWRNQVPHVWSVHIRDADSPMCFSNGKGATKDAALCSALGEYIERISNNYFYNDYFLGDQISNDTFVHYPNEKWFPLDKSGEIPTGLMDENFLAIFNSEEELLGNHLIDSNSGNEKRGVCALPFIRQSDQEKIYIPVNLIGNIFVSNGMSAGNTKYEARVQCLSEIFERAIKNKIITEELVLPDVPKSVLEMYPLINEGIKELENKGYPILVKDASLGGKYPVMCVTLMNPINGGVFASFGAHPKFEVALERSLTELLQGRSFEGLNDTTPPTFNENAVCEHNNIIDHFIDSTGVISWKFFSTRSDFDFSHWDFPGTTEDEYSFLMEILAKEKKEVYIADYEELGAKACRILVPGFSEIYQPEDLVWDNSNQALKFREDILNIHALSDKKLAELNARIIDSELDDYTPISELIGIAFDENSVWGQLTIAELKCLIHLSLKELEEASMMVQMLMNFNDCSSERKKFFRSLDAVLSISLSETLKLDDYLLNMSKMFGHELLNLAIDSVNNKTRFPGLFKTNMNLKGIDKHLKLLESYEKLQKKKRDFTGNTKNL